MLSAGAAGLLQLQAAEAEGDGGAGGSSVEQLRLRRRDEARGNASRGTALLCFASASGREAAAAALASVSLGGLRQAVAAAPGAGGHLRLLRSEREAAARSRCAAAEAAAAAAEARRAARAPHRARRAARLRAAAAAVVRDAARAALGLAPLPPPSGDEADVYHESEAAAELHDAWRALYARWPAGGDGGCDPAQAPLDWAAAPPGVAPTARADRKRAQVDAMLSALHAANLLPRGCVAAPSTSGGGGGGGGNGAGSSRLCLWDCGCGSGALALPLAWAYPDADVVCVDLKPAAIAALAERAAAAGLANVTPLRGRIAAALAGTMEEEEGGAENVTRPAARPPPPPPPPGLVLGLHVCGGGTDEALAGALARRAAFCLSPCCVGKLGAGARPRSGALARRLPPSSPAAAGGASPFGALAAAADFAGHSGVSGYDTAASAGALPRAARAVVAHDRVQWAREQGYDVVLLKLPKGAAVLDDLILGWPAEWRARGVRWPGA